jgi:hypothetical protein
LLPGDTRGVRCAGKQSVRVRCFSVLHLINRQCSGRLAQPPAPSCVHTAKRIVISGSQKCHLEQMLLWPPGDLRRVD